MDKVYVSPWLEDKPNRLPIYRVYVGSGDRLVIEYTGEGIFRYRVGNVYSQCLMEAVNYVDEKLAADGAIFLTQEQWNKYQILA